MPSGLSKQGNQGIHSPDWEGSLRAGLGKYKHSIGGIILQTNQISPARGRVSGVKRVFVSNSNKLDKAKEMTG